MELEEKILIAEDNLLWVSVIVVERMQAYNRPNAWPVEEEVYRIV